MGEQANEQDGGIGAAASQAYGEAIEGGASPQEAFVAAGAAAREVATEMGVSPADFQQGMDAATEAFGGAIANGETPGDAFGSAMTAANDATDDGIDMGAAPVAGGQTVTPPVVDPMEAALDNSAAASDASGAAPPASGGAPPTVPTAPDVAVVPPPDDDTVSSTE